jgi:hypothetical protein
MKAAREPWVLATSINLSAHKVIRKYATRMQIEECFRDLKAPRQGWSLDYVRSETELPTASAPPNCGRPCGRSRKRFMTPPTLTKCGDLSGPGQLAGNFRFPQQLRRRPANSDERWPQQLRVDRDSGASRSSCVADPRTRATTNARSRSNWPGAGSAHTSFEALKRLHVPVLRWPGSCFADEYHWRGGVGSRADRPKMVNTHWGGDREQVDGLARGGE